MPANILAKYSAEDLTGINSAAIAFTDPDLKIVWYSQLFKEKVSASRIKGVTVESLFDINKSDKINATDLKKTQSFKTASNSELILTPLFAKTASRKKLKGFLVELSTRAKSSIADKEVVDSLPQKFSLQNELRDILILLVKESSIEKVAEEILRRAVKEFGGDAGIILFHNEKGKHDFLFFDPEIKIKNRTEGEKILTAEFSFVAKWLERNQKPLLIDNKSEKIGFHLTQVFNCDSVLILPAYFESSLLASMVVLKNKDDFSTSQINAQEQLSALLAFTIGSIRTRELNTALESRLLQAQKLETIGKLSSGMAHDFSNLLSSIFGSINLLRKRVESSENTDRLIDNIENCAVRAHDLTRGLLSFGKPTPKRKELVKPNILLAEITKVITQTFPGTIKFSSEIEEKLHDILGSGTEIYQILLNLCVNAKEATDEKGEIFLSAHNISIDKSNRANYPFLDEGNFVCFSVRDNGVGIKENDLQKIFDPYFSTKNKETGSGLGLYVTYGIIKAHGGHVDVSSKPNDGTIFQVYIPAFEPTKINRVQPDEKIILLADDEPMLSELLAELLESNGYNVIKVASGDEALKLLTEEIKVDLAIIDYNMPGRSGLSTIEEIRKLNFDIPIILSSGSMKVDEDFDIDEFKINSRLQKPYEFDTMLSTIKQLI